MITELVKRYQKQKIKFNIYCDSKDGKSLANGINKVSFFALSTMIPFILFPEYGLRISIILIALGIIFDFLCDFSKRFEVFFTNLRIALVLIALTIIIYIFKGKKIFNNVKI